MKDGKRKAAAVASARHSLPNSAPSNKRIPQPPTTPAPASNKRSARQSTATPSTDTRPLKAPRTQHTTPRTARHEEHAEAAEEDGDSEVDAFTSLCALVSSLATWHSASLSSTRATTANQSTSVLSSLHRLSPASSLSSHLPPPAAALPAVRLAAQQLCDLARSFKHSSSSTSLLITQLQQLQSTAHPLSAADTYAILLSTSVALCQTLHRQAATHSTATAAGAGVGGGELSGRYVERVTGLFGAELDALRKEGESSVGAACLPLLAQSMQHIIVAHLPTDSAHGDERTLVDADLQRWAAAQQVK